MKWTAGFALFALLAGCNDGVKVGPPEVIRDEDPADNPSPAPEFKGLAYDAPAAWKSENPSNNLRMAQYKVGTDSPALVTLSHFGLGSGTREENLARWHGSVIPEEGGPDPREETFKVSGFDVTTLDLQGTYLDPFGQKHADHRVLFGLVETPGGAYYFKFFGPRNTVSGHVEAFGAMLRSVREKK